ncbi:MAG TPA: protease inhibitor I42 family protein [Thermoplasmata archaeon]|nr:protease inhibitor I42 family protein [Thermoplasmata archaeon]
MVQVGGRFVLELESNPTTGYRWEPEFDSSLLRLAAHRFEPGADRPGAGGRQRFEFEGRTLGHGVLRFHYRSSWRPGSAGEREYEVAVLA